jgi:hypothetical protein
MNDLDENKALVRRYFEESFNDRALDGPEHLRRTVAWLTDQ